MLPLFKTFPNKLVYSRFLPGFGSLPPEPVLLQWRCFSAFLTCQAGRHRQCPKRAPRGLQEGTKRPPKEPSDHKLPPVFLVLRTQETHGNKQHQKAAITGVLGFTNNTQRQLSLVFLVLQTTPKGSYHQCSCAIDKPHGDNDRVTVWEKWSRQENDADTV